MNSALAQANPEGDIDCSKKKSHKVKQETQNHEFERLKKFEEMVCALTKEKIVNEAKVGGLMEEKSQLEAMVSELNRERNRLVEEKNEVEIMLKKSDAYATTLSEHVTELESIGTTLQCQREKQNEYFIQKQLSAKQRTSARVNALMRDNKQLTHQLATNREETNIIRDELELIRNEKDDLLREKFRRKGELKTLHQRLKKFENQVEIEQETVKLLSNKNGELSVRLSQLESELARCRSEERSELCGGELSQREMDELWRSKWEKHRSELDNSNHRILHLTQKLATAEARLEAERRERHLVESELEKAERGAIKLKKANELLLTITTSHHQHRLRSSSSSYHPSPHHSTPNVSMVMSAATPPPSSSSGSDEITPIDAVSA